LTWAWLRAPGETTLLRFRHLLEKHDLGGAGGYEGQTKAIREAAPNAQDITCKRTRFKQTMHSTSMG
jgi:hypothetical protein